MDALATHHVNLVGTGLNTAAAIATLVDGGNFEPCGWDGEFLLSVETTEANAQILQAHGGIVTSLEQMRKENWAIP